MKLTDQHVKQIEHLEAAVLNVARVVGENYLAAIQRFSNDFDQKWKQWLETRDGRAYLAPMQRLRAALESSS